MEKLAKRLIVIGAILTTCVVAIPIITLSLYLFGLGSDFNGYDLSQGILVIFGLILIITLNWLCVIKVNQNKLIWGGLGIIVGVYFNFLGIIGYIILLISKYIKIKKAIKEIR